MILNQIVPILSTALTSVDYVLEPWENLGVNVDTSKAPLLKFTTWKLTKVLESTSTIGTGL